MKKKWKVILPAAILLIALCIGIGGYRVWYYFFYDGYKAAIAPLPEAEDAVAFEPLKEEKPDVRGMALAAENDILKLYLDEKTTQIAVVDKRSGYIAYSNPQQKDMVASGGNEEELKSQLIVQYYNKKGSSAKMNNYALSVENGTFTVEGIQNGVRITYQIGDLASPTGIVPVYITKERLQSAVLDHLDESTAKTVLSKYAESKTKEGFLELAQGVVKSKLTLKKVNGYFEEAGYTVEDYQADMALAEGEEEENISFVIPLEYRIDGDELIAGINTQMIEERGGGRIANLTLLKFFGCGSEADEGYMLVPNGSGALISYNNGCTQEAYQQAVYGTDLTSANYINLEKTEPARLPVFGISREAGGIFARITQAESIASVNAEVPCKQHSQNTVYASFTLRQTEQLSMTSGSQSDMLVVEEEMYPVCMEVSYAFLQEGACDYSAMASWYRNRLTEDGVLTAMQKEGDIPLFLDVVGAIMAQKSFLGIPYMEAHAMTTYKEAGEIAEDLLDGGIRNLRMNYLGWANRGYYHDVPDKISLVGSLGKSDELTGLAKFVEESGGCVTGDTAFVRVPYTSKRFSKMFESAKYYSGVYVEMGLVNPATVRSTGLASYDETYYYLLSPKYLSFYVDRFIKETAKLPIGYALRDLGADLVSDKKKSELIDRNEAEQIYRYSLEQLKKTGKDITVKGGNFYALPYADAVTDIPYTSNGYYICDESIPFYQMVLHGFTDYAGKDMNLNNAGTAEESLLLLLETGSCPKYAVSYSPSSEMKNTGMASYYSTEYDLYSEEIKELYAEVNEVLSQVRNEFITEHRIIEDGVRAVTYGNGLTIYINYTDEEAEADGIMVAPKSYEVRKEAAK